MKCIQIILPSILCVLIIYITKMSILYYPLSFGLVIGLINWKIYKYNPYSGVLLSVLVSYISFWLAIFSIWLMSNLRELITSNTNYELSEDGAAMYYLLISVYIIAPLLVFFLYKFVFNFSKTKFNLTIIIMSIIILLSIYGINSDYIIDKYPNTLPYILWQFIMGIALQIIITQNKLKI